ncbi:MAG TPA: hypothetical protein VLZ89_13000 [Anaerolineales bacterium]|nr:hypothetical protein [Anaerolineales bacterium]
MNTIYLRASLALYGRLLHHAMPNPVTDLLNAAGGGSCGGSTSAGIFAPVLAKLLPLARDAWGFGTAVLIVIASLGGLYFALKGTAGASIGGSGMASGAIIGMVTVIIVVLMAFLLLPQLSCLLQNSAPAAPF